MSEVEGSVYKGAIQATRRLWRGPVTGSVMRVVTVVVGVPTVISLVFATNPPAGVYLNGVIVGSLYALIAMGLILVYRANRVINFAQASMGGAPAVAAVVLMANRGWPYPIVIVLGLGSALALGALVEFAIIRRFSRSPRLILTLATIGVAQVLLYLEASIPSFIGNESFRAYFLRTPFSRFKADIGGTTFTGNHLMTVVVVAVVAGSLGALLRFTSLGMAVRASAENAERASLLGVPVRRVQTMVWAIAALVSAIGVFQRVTVVQGLSFGGGLSATTLLYGLAPAVIARMQSMPVAFGAAITLGMIDQATFYATRNSTISNAMLLPIILVALLVQRTKLSRAEDSGVATWRQVKEFRGIPRELLGVPQVVIGQWVVRVVAVGVIAFLPILAGQGKADLASLLIVYAIVGVSLVILTGWAGQISLGQLAFAAAGAAIAGGLVANHDVPFLLAMMIAGLAGAGLAVLIGIPAVRLPGLYLAVTTLAFAASVQYFFLDTRYFGWLLPKADAHVDRPVLWGRVDLRSDMAFYYTCVAVLVLAVACARSMRSLRLGRVMIAVRDNTRAAQSFGINVTQIRIAAFALSGFFAALAGGLMAHLQGVVEPQSFTASRSLQIFAMAVIGGLTSVGGALAGALYVVGFQYFLPDYAVLASGMGMLLLMIFFPGGLSEVGFTLRDAYLRRVAIARSIHVPSLLADSLDPALHGLDEAEEHLVEAASEHAVEVVDTAEVDGSPRRPRARRPVGDAAFAPPARAGGNTNGKGNAPVKRAAGSGRVR